MLPLDVVARQLQEQQLQARQLVLQQQAASAVAAASKTQREVRSDSLHLLVHKHALIPSLPSAALSAESVECAAVAGALVSLHCLCRCHSACCIACAGAASCITF